MGELRCKTGARFKKFTEPMLTLLGWLEFYAAIENIGLVLTSANDGKHAKDSRHYLDRAIDLRTKDKTDNEIKALVNYLLKTSGQEIAPIRIKIELDKNDRHWVTSADEIRFPPPNERWSNQHIHVEVR